MPIRNARIEDLPLLMDLFEKARLFMARQGNPNQWGRTNWPPREVIEKDIQEGKSLLFEENGVVLGTFFLDFGEEIEPVYKQLDTWEHDGPYAVIHRIASNGQGHHILEKAVALALTKAKHVRIDTHRDNKPMLAALQKLGFVYRGEVHFDHDPHDGRLAFEK